MGVGEGGDLRVAVQGVAGILGIVGKISAAGEGCQADELLAVFFPERIGRGGVFAQCRDAFSARLDFPKCGAAKACGFGAEYGDERALGTVFDIDRRRGSFRRRDRRRLDGDSAFDGKTRKFLGDEFFNEIHCGSRKRRGRLAFGQGTAPVEPAFFVGGKEDVDVTVFFGAELYGGGIILQKNLHRV